MFALSVAVYEIFAEEICMILTLTFTMGHDQMYTCQSRTNLRLPMIWQIVTFAISITLCEIFTFELPKWFRLEYSTFKEYVKVMRYNVTKYVVRQLLL